MQWETATPVGFPVCVRHNDYIGIVMGDFNDRIWPVAHPNRWWQHKLLDGSLLDPGMSLSPPDAAAQPSLATRKGERLDAILFSPMRWHCTPPASMHTCAYPSAGDHQGVTVLCVGDFGAASATCPPVVGSVRAWPKHKFQTFRRHMARWSQRQPDLGTPFERHFRILNEVARFVESTPPPTQTPDHIENALCDAVTRNPTSAQALSDWGTYMGKKQTTAAHKALRRFRKSAVFSTKTFKIMGLHPFPLRTTTTQHAFCSHAPAAFRRRPVVGSHDSLKTFAPGSVYADRIQT